MLPIDEMLIECPDCLGLYPFPASVHHSQEDCHALVVRERDRLRAELAAAQQKIAALEAARAAAAEAGARAMKIAAMTALYDADSDLHVIVFELDPAAIARAALAERAGRELKV